MEMSFQSHVLLTLPLFPFDLSVVQGIFFLPRFFFPRDGAAGNIFGRAGRFSFIDPPSPFLPENGKPSFSFSLTSFEEALLQGFFFLPHFPSLLSPKRLYFFFSCDGEIFFPSLGFLSSPGPRKKDGLAFVVSAWQ